jgi:transposase
MNKIELTEKKREELKRLQKNTKNTRVFKKIATILGLDIGINYESLADILSLDKTTIRRYEKEYLLTNQDDFLEDNYKPYWGKLDSFQLSELKEEITNNLYQTSSEIVTWIEKKFNVKYHIQGLIHLLHKLGFVYKKTKLIPAKANREEQLEFLDKFNNLQANLNEDEVIYFGDAVHPQHNTQIANGWIPKGKEKEIKSNTGRTRINLNGVLNPFTKEVIIREDKTINAQSTIELYKEIEEKNPGKEKIYIIIDNARYYRCGLLDEYLKTSKIKQIFLPPYSPNLNLIERLWKFMKKKIIYNKY